MNLKEERDRIVSVSNDLRGELNYVKKNGETKSEACIKDLQDRQLEFDTDRKVQKDISKGSEAEWVRWKQLYNLETANKDIQVNTIFEIPVMKDDPEVRSNDRYNYNPDFIVSQSVGFDPNDDIYKLHNEVNDLRQSIDIMRLEHARKTLDDFETAKFTDEKENEIDYFNQNTVEALLKHREELDKESYKMPVYRDSPVRDTDRGIGHTNDGQNKARKDKYIKNRLNELKNWYEDNLDEFIDDSEQSVF